MILEKVNGQKSLKCPNIFRAELKMLGHFGVAPLLPIGSADRVLGYDPQENA